MEELVTMFCNVYRNRRVLVTGHTGFKGSWLTSWLQTLGSDVSGISLPPKTLHSHWNLLDLDIDSRYIDIRDENNIKQAFVEIQPEIVFHLAAQPLVRLSYQQPLETWSTNVIGTANILNACRNIECLSSILVVTTDKCYENKEWVWGYRETDPLGGYDPYSASKAGTELVVVSYRKSFFNETSSPLLATARAGNVIGGGDWSLDRLIPDLVRSRIANESLEIRSPHATRPWQHVLECLSGYLLLGQQLLSRNPIYADAWNFGPNHSGNRSVSEVLSTMKAHWSELEWHCGEQSHPHEATLLHLDSSKARQMLAWKPVWTFEEGVAATASWYQEWLTQQAVATQQQLDQYCQLARLRNLAWAKEKL